MALKTVAFNHLRIKAITIHQPTKIVQQINIPRRRVRLQQVLQLNLQIKSASENLIFICSQLVLKHI